MPGAEEMYGAASAPIDVSVLMRMGPLVSRLMPSLEHALRNGGGIPYEKYQPEFTQMQDRINKATYDRLLLTEWVPSAGLGERLAGGSRVADLGTGAGHALCLLAAAYPRSRFVGYDVDTAALELASRRAAERGLHNVEFRHRDVGGELDDRYDVVLAIDTAHDLPDPLGMLRAARCSLHTDGVLVLIEPSATGDLDIDTAQSRAVLRYLSSFFHCMQVSLAAGGPGLGNGWPTDAVITALREAGFTGVEPVVTTTGQTIFQATTPR